MWAALQIKLKGWKTLLLSAVLFVGGTVLTVLQALDVYQIEALLPDKYKPFAPIVIALIGLVVGWLRWITTGPVGDKS